MVKGISINIGINSVDPVHYQGWDGKLTACENDAKSMQDIAIKQGFQTNLLLTKKATADAILQAIAKAANDLDTNDFLFLTASLHGGQLIDDDSDEEDGQDETWCAYDREILDDELAVLWQKFKPGVRILVLSDSCHSGTVVRIIPRGRGKNAKLRVPISNVAESIGGLNVQTSAIRALPFDVALRTYDNNKEVYDKIRKDALQRKDSKQIKANVKLISGCQDNQTSLDGDLNGAFTAALLHTWNNGLFDGDYEKFHRRIVKLLPSTQSPNLYNVGTRSESFDNQKPFTL